MFSRASLVSAASLFTLVALLGCEPKQQPEKEDKPSGPATTTTTTLLVMLPPSTPTPSCSVRSDR